MGALVLTGCGASLRSLPPSGLTAHRTLALFHNGFHSGLLIHWPEPDLAFLDLRSDDAPAQMPWLEIGFGADAWTRLGGGFCTGMRLAFTTSPGVLMVRHHPTCQPALNEGEPVRVWEITLDARGWSALVDRLRDGLDLTVHYPRKPGADDWICFTTTRWSIFNNCHDWTAGCLEAAGLDLRPRAWRTSDGFADEVQAIVDKLRGAGIIVVGPPRALQPSTS